jgi:pyruvate,water dikinase
VEAATECGGRATRRDPLPELPAVEPADYVFQRRGYGASMDNLAAYHDLIDSIFRVWQVHMEIVMIGFAAYFTFYDFCKKAFPGDL